MFIDEVRQVKNEKDLNYWIQYYKEEILHAQRNGKSSIEWKGPSEYRDQIANWFKCNGFGVRVGRAARHRFMYGTITW